MSQYAFVTLLTSESYLPGALVLAAALKDVHQSLPPGQQVIYETVCLVTPETLDALIIEFLRKVFDVVIGVEVLGQPDGRLVLLGRPDLDTVLSKLHVLRLTQYSKVILLDADVLPVRPLCHLFNIEHEFAAVPDVGWPDIFNSGVMVLSPGEDKFNAIFDLLKSKGSWDGGDQGIFNEWRGDDWHRLSFTYNTTPTAVYTYAPAYERFGSQISAIHFIGPDKPWHTIPHRALDSSTSTMAGQLVHTERVYSYSSLVDRWYDVYDRYYRSQPVGLSIDFEVSKYTSVRNDHGRPNATEGESAPSALSLGDLRRVALAELESLNVNRLRGEGEYRAMPLEGRFDLIRPLTRAERKQQGQTSPALSLPQSPTVGVNVRVEPSKPAEPLTPLVQITASPHASSVRWTTLPTPRPDELPATPHARLLSLPSTPLYYVPPPYPTTPASCGPEIVINSQRIEESPVHSRPSSPPLSKWDSALERPKDLPSASAFIQSNTYFPDVLDHHSDDVTGSPAPACSVSSKPIMAVGETSMASAGRSPSRARKSSAAFFGLPSAPSTPQILLRQSFSSHAIDTSESGPQLPDSKKIKRILPWEERSLHTPGEDEASFLASPSIRTTLERRFLGLRPPVPSPLPEIFYHSRNVWEDSPGSQKTHRKQRSLLSLKLTGSTVEMKKSHKVDEANTQDGDAEEANSDGESHANISSRDSPTDVVNRKFLRSVDVQTEARGKRDQGVQVVLHPKKNVAQPSETLA